MAECTRSWAFIFFVGYIVFVSAQSGYGTDGSGYDSSGDYYPCDPNPCGNNGTCMVTMNGWYKCHCGWGVYGWNCDEVIEPGTLKIEVENCEIDDIIEGDSKSLSEWCAQDRPESAEDMYVRVIGAEPGQSYNFELVMVYQDEETVWERMITASSEDVTFMVGDMVWSAPAPMIDGSAGKVVCNNFDAHLSIRVTPNSDPMKIFETDKHRVSVLCNFTGVDLEVTSNGAIPVLSSANDGTSLGNTIADPGIVFQVQEVAGSESLPLPGESQYYLVVFLTKRLIKDPAYCEEDYDIPDLTFADHILWYKRFTSIQEVSGVDSELKGIELHAPGRCGEYNLVILVDPLVTIVRERRCNNFVHMQVNLGGCPASDEPMCQVIPNAFTNGRETAFTYHHGLQMNTISGLDMPDNRMYKYRGYATWYQEMDSDVDMLIKNMYEVSRDGYGRLKLLERYIRDQIRDGALPCGDFDDAALQTSTCTSGHMASGQRRIILRCPDVMCLLDAMNQVKDLEGLDSDDIPIPGEDFHTVVPEYFNALWYLKQIRDGNMTADEVLGGVQPSVENLPLPVDNTMREKLIYWVSVAAIYAVGNYSEAVVENRVEMMRAESPMHLCQAGEIMRRITEMKQLMPRWEENAQEYDKRLMKEMSDITAIMVLMNEFYGGARFVPCMDKMFERIVKFVTGDVEDDKWLFDDDCGGDINSCLKKVQSVCGNSNDQCAEETSFNQDENLCAMRHMKNMIEREYKSFGIHDIRRKLRQDKRER